MQKLLYSLIFALFFQPLFCDDEEEIRSKLPMLLGANNMGTDFWISIPPIMDASGGSSNYIKIFAVSPVKTEVKVEIAGKGFSKIFTVNPNSTSAMTIAPDMAFPFLYDETQKSPETQVYAASALHITSGSPVAIYIVVRYVYNSDGFLAIPSPALGKKYIAQTYREMGWTAEKDGGHYPPWVMISAAHDNTKVKVIMGGSANGNNALKFPDGVKIKTGQAGESPLLQKGDVWCLTIDDFFNDMSGTIIESDKPVSVVTGHVCANVPSGNNWCEYMAEMLAPVQSWGNVYVVPAVHKRRYNGILRISAADDNTEVLRNGEYFLTIAKGGGERLDIGYAEKRMWDKPAWPKPAVITSDLPIDIMYYNPGIQEDGAGGLPNVNSDPFMMRIVPVNQFQNDMILTVPNSAGGTPYTENYMILVFETNGDPDIMSKMELSFFDGKKTQITTVAEKFDSTYEDLPGEYQGRTYAMKTITLDNGYDTIYRLRAEGIKFTCYQFGYSAYDGYGYPAASGLISAESGGDLIPPVAESISYGDDKISFGVSDETALWDVYLLADSSKNVNLSREILTDKTAGASITVSDPESFRAEIMMVDRAGNKSYKVFTGPFSSVREELFEGGELSISPNPVENILNVEFTNKVTGRLKIDILDVTGSLVKELADMKLNATSRNSLSYDTGCLSAGTYLLKVDMNGSSVIEKFMVRR